MSLILFQILGSSSKLAESSVQILFHLGFDED